MRRISPDDLRIACKSAITTDRMAGHSRWTYWELPDFPPDMEGFTPAAVLTVRWDKVDGYTARLSDTRIRFIRGVEFSEPYRRYPAIDLLILTEPAPRWQSHRFELFARAALTQVGTPDSTPGSSRSVLR